MQGPISARTYGTERLVAVSDGVFAIVVTLLVLDLRLPEPPKPGVDILDALSDDWPDFVGWLVSFIVIARLWTIHHHVLATMARCRTATVVLNFAFLGLLSLVPFGASLIGIYGFKEPEALAIFSIVFGLAALSLGLLARHAASEPQLLHPDAEDLSWHYKHHVVVVPLLAVLAASVAFLDAGVAILIWPVESALLAATSLRARHAG